MCGTPRFSPSPRRGEGRGEGRALAKALPTTYLCRSAPCARPLRCDVPRPTSSRQSRIEATMPVRGRTQGALPQRTNGGHQQTATISSSTRCAAPRHEPSLNPCVAVRGGRSGPQGCPTGRRALFVRAGARSKSPAAPHGLAGRSPDSATRGALSFGYFSLSTQRKVTRPSAEGRKPAAGEQAGGNARSKARVTRTTASAEVTDRKCRGGRQSRTGCAPTEKCRRFNGS